MEIVCEEKMLIEALENGTAEWAPAPAPSTIKEMVTIYEKQSADIVRRWKALPAARWDGSLEFFGGQRPASPMAWSFLFDIVHHRGQITTYLRPMGAAAIAARSRAWSDHRSDPSPSSVLPANPSTARTATPLTARHRS